MQNILALNTSNEVTNKFKDQLLKINEVNDRFKELILKWSMHS